MKNNNLRVRAAIEKAGIMYRDLAKTMGISPTTLSTCYMRAEMSRATQDELIELIKKTKERLENEMVSV